LYLFFVDRKFNELQNKHFNAVLSQPPYHPCAHLKNDLLLILLKRSDVFLRNREVGPKSKDQQEDCVFGGPSTSKSARAAHCGVAETKPYNRSTSR
jgi:hypothetical protein